MKDEIETKETKREIVVESTNENVDLSLCRSTVTTLGGDEETNDSFSHGFPAFQHINQSNQPDGHTIAAGFRAEIMALDGC